MTESIAILTQINMSNTYPIVVEKGSEGYTFHYVPTVNDAVVSTDNPMPVIDPALATNAADVLTALNDLSSQIATTITTLTTLLTAAINAVP